MLVSTLSSFHEDLSRFIVKKSTRKLTRGHNRQQSKSTRVRELTGILNQ